MKNKLRPYNIRFAFQTKCKISNLFTFKDKIALFLNSGIVYKFQYGSCNATYYGKTYILNSECVDTLDFLHSLGKELKAMRILPLKNIIFCNHTRDFEDFSILATNNNDFEVTLMESLLINRDHPPLHKNKQSLPLELFDS